MRQRGTELLADEVFRRAGMSTRRPEDADGAGRLREQPEALDELCLDPQDAPGIGVHPVRRTAGVEQPLVGGGHLDLVAPEHDRSALLLRHPVRILELHPADASW